MNTSDPSHHRTRARAGVSVNVRVRVRVRVRVGVMVRVRVRVRDPHIGPFTSASCAPEGYCEVTIAWCWW